LDCPQPPPPEEIRAAAHEIRAEKGHVPQPEDFPGEYRRTGRPTQGFVARLRHVGPQNKTPEG
jgi:hypothetical protein